MTSGAKRIQGNENKAKKLEIATTGDTLAAHSTTLLSNLLRQPPESNPTAMDDISHDFRIRASGHTLSSSFDVAKWEGCENYCKTFSEPVIFCMNNFHDFLRL